MTSPRAAAGPAADSASGSALISPQRRNLIFVAIVLGMLLAALDQTIVATALPTIVADLGDAGHQSWVVTSYLLASTIVTALVGKLGDVFGRKRVFQAAVLFFVVGSVSCGLAQSMAMLVGSRALQGIGGGGITVTASALIGEVVPLRDRGRYQGILPGRSLRRHDGHRSVAGRLLHRLSDLAVGVLGERARLGAGHLCGGRRHPGAGRVQQTGHRLRVMRIYRCYGQMYGTVRLTDIGDNLRIPFEVLEPTFSRLVAAGYVQRDGDQMWLTAAGTRQVEYVYSLLLAWIVDKLSRSPGFEGRPDRRQVEVALEHVAHQVLAQRDWYDGPPTSTGPGAIPQAAGCRR